MTKNEKVMSAVIVIAIIIIAWLLLRYTKKGNAILQQVADEFNLPELVAPIIDLGDAPTYEIAAPPDLSATLAGMCCPTCTRERMRLPPSQPQVIEQATVAQVENIIYSSGVLPQKIANFDDYVSNKSQLSISFNGG